MSRAPGEPGTSRSLRLIIASILALAVSLGLVQQQRAVIAGRVTDESGRPTPGVTVEVMTNANEPAGHAVTDGRGEFRILVAPGDYSVSVRLAGFKPEKRRNLRVSADAETRVDFALRVGCMEEDVIAMPRSMREAVSWFAGVAHIKILRQLPWSRDDGNAARFQTAVIEWAKPVNATDRNLELVQECVYTLDDDGGRTGTRAQVFVEGEEYVAFLWKRGGRGPYLSSLRRFMLPVVHGRITANPSLARIGIRTRMRAADLTRLLREAARAEQRNRDGS